MLKELAGSSGYARAGASRPLGFETREQQSSELIRAPSGCASARAAVATPAAAPARWCGQPKLNLFSSFKIATILNRR